MLVRPSLWLRFPGQTVVPSPSAALGRTCDGEAGAGGQRGPEGCLRPGSAGLRLGNLGPAWWVGGRVGGRDLMWLGGSLYFSSEIKIKLQRELLLWCV